MIPARQFQTILLDWYDKNGRKGLPWQHNPTPYRVWVSEIMLQQTQVATVIPYYLRFMDAFPEVQSLASADLDEVLPLWAGLGYYTRARNLHRAAQKIVADFDGRFPETPEQLSTLPGIGHSTAGAIINLAFNRPAPMLDGNVKRLWTRLHGIETWPGESTTEKQLWQLSEIYLPPTRCREYTQALMDFGATLCTRTGPQCDPCPLKDHCLAFKSGKVASIPAKKPTSLKPIKKSYWLVLHNNQNHFFLIKRPPSGIWGGLWAFPQWESRHALENHCQNTGIDPKKIQWLNKQRHTFTHFHLDFTPAVYSSPPSVLEIKESTGQWHRFDNPHLAAPAPVKKLMQALLV
ncbi:MAG: hypothetical protein AXA67_03320 [Methylothermaceae bacteria B42]|nr:MAG: hypothetical protein AXA67_03320 [Methylothermaceae bacteria B42]HHJ38133.1 A/G-specific adenine glycosylase [Methylothermaceae bacterium]